MPQPGASILEILKLEIKSNNMLNQHVDSNFQEDQIKETASSTLATLYATGWIEKDSFRASMQSLYMTMYVQSKLEFI